LRKLLPNVGTGRPALGRQSFGGRPLSSVGESSRCSRERLGCTEPLPCQSRLLGWSQPFLYCLRIGLSSPVALIGLPTGRPLCGLQIVLTEIAATVDIDFVAGDIRVSGNVGVPIDINVTAITVITAAAPMPAVAITAYSVAVIMTDVVVIIPIIIVGPFHDAPGQKSSHHCSGTEINPGISA